MIPTNETYERGDLVYCHFNNRQGRVLRYLPNKDQYLVQFSPTFFVYCNKTSLNRAAQWTVSDEDKYVT